MSETSHAAPETTFLKGVKVLDLSRLLPGPFASLLLADMGADVLKIEDPRGGDYARYYPPLVDGVGAFYASVNRNKRSMTLDLKCAQGREVLERLLEDRDVLLESFRPGVMARLGLDPQGLRERFPGLVICSVSGFGQSGPARDRAGHDLNFVARAGLLDQNARAGEAPVVPGYQVADLAGGALYAALGICGALFARSRSGEGAWLDISMSEGALSLMAPAIAMRAAGEAMAPGQGMLSGGLPCYRVYETADGRYMAVAALEPKFWEALIGALKKPELSGRGMLSGEDGEEVAAELASIFRSQPQSHWEQMLGEVDCCVEPVRELGELVDDAIYQARNVFFELQGVRQVRSPVRVVADGNDVAAHRPAPEHGEHTEEVLNALGYTSEAIDALRRQGAIAQGSEGVSVAGGGRSTP
ncbi:CoA transferase [Lujinxingia vulgaris]|uniref:CoA transferase n=1 Tax=Lujinxingia vulgaris TaxID=2600176 RepID=A0A5C6XIB0_9DELT|nr:CaiB/BaiF CoA-transferase family protein [Lujinxingia vulgaris]TXD39678.1 CoA transferase [Lujinxingia vulgaris]